MRTVFRGAPGTAAFHSTGGSCSTKRAVTRLFVRHAAMSVARRSGTGPDTRSTSCVMGMPLELFVLGATLIAG
jgi:hypothetical protein